MTWSNVYSIRYMFLLLLISCAATLVLYGIRSEYHVQRFGFLQQLNSTLKGVRRCILISDHKVDMKTELNQTAPFKTILMWNGADRVEMSTFGLGHEAFVQNNCPVSNCMMTNDSSIMPIEEFDAILFNIPLLFKLNYSERFPTRRKAHQRYVYFSQESPFYNVEDLRQYAGFFNWTMSFQNYSDIPLRFGWIERLQGPQSKSNYQPTTTNYKKTKLIAWFVSHCNSKSKREVYVRELQKYIPVDVYGHCGQLKCGRDDWAGISEPHCHNMLSRDYKFYLSFENSMCNEYVTEKFYAILHQDVVPIVMGRANYSDIAPPHSFINALQYNTPKELADYLYLLDANQTLYNEYFRWKKDFKVHSGYKEMAREAYCLLCEKLNNDTEAKIYEDMISDWGPLTQCRFPHYFWYRGPLAD